MKKKNKRVKEIAAAFRLGVKAGEGHSNPSPVTLKFIEETREAHDLLKGDIKKIHDAMFGDGNGELGIQKKVATMYDSFFSGNIILKFLHRAFMGIVVLAGLVYTLIQIIKHSR